MSGIKGKKKDKGNGRVMKEIKEKIKRNNLE